VPTSWAIAGTAESAVLASSKARLPVIRGFIRDGITHLKNEPLAHCDGEILDRVPRDIRI
jgi:hypothetical protein